MSHTRSGEATVQCAIPLTVWPTDMTVGSESQLGRWDNVRQRLEFGVSRCVVICCWCSAVHVPPPFCGCLLEVKWTHECVTACEGDTSEPQNHRGREAESSPQQHSNEPAAFTRAHTNSSPTTPALHSAVGHRGRSRRGEKDRHAARGRVRVRELERRGEERRGRVVGC